MRPEERPAAALEPRVDDGEGSRASAAIRALAEAARAGDRDAFARLYEIYGPVVHGILLSLVRRDDARELVNEVFLLALRGIARLEDVARFGPWLCSIARNCARDALKGRHEPAQISDDLAEPERGDASGDAEEAARVLALVRALPEAYRETLVLRLVEGLGGPEIAERTGMTPGSVRVNLCRGMKLLRERLGGAGGAR